MEGGEQGCRIFIIIMDDSYPSQHTSSNSNSSRQNPTDQHDPQSIGHVRWFILQRTDQSQPVSKLLPFIIDKALRAAAGNLKIVKRLQNGDILLEASTSVQSRCLSHLKDLGVV